jgi:hypothetical protein
MLQIKQSKVDQMELYRLTSFPRNSGFTGDGLPSASLLAIQDGAFTFPSVDIFAQ